MNNNHDLRNVLTLSREIRIRMRDASVLYASVVGEDDENSFLVRPWGVKHTIAIRFDDVSSARPVSRMSREAQRAISASQAALALH